MTARPSRPPQRPSRRRPDDRRGTATVEFSFCAAIVFMLFMGMIEVARFHIVRHSMDQAVYMGARVGIIPGATAEDVERTVQDRLAAAGIVSATIQVTPTVIDDDTEEVTVGVTAPFEQNSWALPKFFGGMTVDAQITLDHENVAFD